MAPDRLSTRYFCHTSKPYDVTDIDAVQEMAALTKLHFEQDIEEKLLFQCNSCFYSIHINRTREMMLLRLGSPLNNVLATNQYQYIYTDR